MNYNKLVFRCRAGGGLGSQLGFFRDFSNEQVEVEKSGLEGKLKRLGLRGDEGEEEG